MREKNMQFFLMCNISKKNVQYFKKNVQFLMYKNAFSLVWTRPKLMKFIALRVIWKKMYLEIL